MAEISKLRHDRFKLIAAFLVVGIISLLQPGCDCSSSDSTSIPSAITSVSPASSSTSALVTTDVTALFRDDMDSATIESAFSLTLNSNQVAATVSYDETTKTATLSPDSDLVSGAEYRATIASSVKDINGSSPLSSDYVWSFTISPAMLLTSKNANGVSGFDVSQSADIDATGRYIVFESKATNMTSDATTRNRLHIYRKDTITGEVILASSTSEGLEGDNDASNPSISSNGRYVVFESKASNFSRNAYGSNLQIYLKDLDNGSIDLVSRNDFGFPDNSATGASNAKVSDDGRYILFQSSDGFMSPIAVDGIDQIYLKDISEDILAGPVQMISRTANDIAGDTASNNPDMSADGTHIVFESAATNLPTSNNLNHIYYVNTSVPHTVEQISVTTNGTEATADSNKPSISKNGSTIVFHSNATNLDEADNNGTSDVFLHYRPLALTMLISANPNTGESGNGASSNAHISDNADYVVFESLALDLAIGGTSGIRSIFVRDLPALPEIIIEKLDIPSSTLPSNEPAISADGRYVSFHSDEAFAGDTNSLSDVFRAHNSAHP
jgi:hypothetical protein